MGFKAIQEQAWAAGEHRLEEMRRLAVGIGPGGGAKREFSLDLSCAEWTEEAITMDFHGVPLLSYSPAAILAEKSRALCQQMPDYPHGNHPRPRPRDYFDIHAIVTEGAVRADTATFGRILEEIFIAKEVPLALLPFLPEQRHFHESDWEAVLLSIPPEREKDFGFYADFLEREVLASLQLP